MFLFNEQMFLYKITPNPFEPSDCSQPVISSPPSLIVLSLENSLTHPSQPDHSNTSYLSSNPLSSPKNKYNKDGSLERHKACLMAQGFNQV